MNREKEIDLKKLNKVNIRKASVPRERYSRELHRYYKSLAVRARGGHRVENMQRFLSELRDLIAENQNKADRLGKVAS